jgi:hypothetical protein
MKACRPELTTAIDEKPHVECRLAPFTSGTPTGRGSFGETWSVWPAFAATANASPGGSITYGSPTILSTGPTLFARAQLRDCANHRAPSASTRTAVHYGGTLSCDSARVNNINPGTAAYIGWLRGHNVVPYFVNGESEGNEAGVCFAAFPGQTNWTCVVSTAGPNGVGPSQTTFLTSQPFNVNAALTITLSFPSRAANFYINGALIFTATTNFSVQADKNVDATWTIREYGLDMNDVAVAAPTLTATLRVVQPSVKMWRPGYMGTRLVHNNW